MKQTLKYIVIGFSLLALSLSANAQHDGTTYNSQGGVSTAKSVTGPDEHGYYKLNAAGMVQADYDEKDYMYDYQEFINWRGGQE